MYLKRYSAPDFWKVKKKEAGWITRPSAGPHKLGFCIPLKILLRDVLKYAENSEEAKKIIKKGKILVDGRERKDPNYPAGLMDVVKVGEETFRIVVDKKGLQVVKVKEGADKLCRINNKRKIKGGVYQLNLHDGRNLLTEEEKYKPGDSILISLPEQKILNHFQLKEGEQAFVISGRNIGFSGTIKNVKERKFLNERNKVVLENKGEKVETLKDYILVGSLQLEKEK